MQRKTVPKPQSHLLVLKEQLAEVMRQAYQAASIAPAGIESHYAWDDDAETDVASIAPAGIESAGGAADL